MLCAYLCLVQEAEMMFLQHCVELLRNPNLSLSLFSMFAASQEALMASAGNSLQSLEKRSHI